MSELLTSASLRTCLKDISLSRLRPSTSSPVESRLVGRIIEYLQELTPAKMKHELWIYRKVWAELETGWILFPILCKFLTQSDEHSIKPPKDIRAVIDLGFEHRDSRHENRGGFLIEGLSDGGVATFVECPCDRSHPEAKLTRSVLVVRHKLDQARLTRLKWLTGWSDHFEIGRKGGLRRKRANLPGRSLADPDLCLADTG